MSFLLNVESRIRETKLYITYVTTDKNSGKKGFLVKRVHRIPKQSRLFPGFCCSQTDCKSELFNTSLTILTELGDVKLMPTKELHPYVPASLLQEGTLHSVKRETYTPTQEHTLYLQWHTS